MPSRKSIQSQVIEDLFLLKGTVTVRELYDALYGDPEGKTERELSQRVGPALTRYCKRTGNDIRPTGKHYHYTLVYA